MQADALVRDLACYVELENVHVRKEVREDVDRHRLHGLTQDIFHLQGEVDEVVAVQAVLDVVVFAPFV